MENFRCFRERQDVRLAPLTLLVGENSTGKTSFHRTGRETQSASPLMPMRGYSVLCIQRTPTANQNCH